MATLSWPARAPKIIRHRSATCCGVPYEDSHFSSCVCSAGSNWIARLLFGMSEIVAVAVKSVKLFKGHYTSLNLCSFLEIRFHRTFIAAFAFNFIQQADEFVIVDHL